MGVDYFPRTRGVSTLASPQVIGKMLRELGSLYQETKNPTSPSMPVRLPDMVKPLRGKKVASGR